MLDLIFRYKHFIKKYRVLLYEHEENILRIKVKITFTDDSTLFIKEYLFGNKERKYAYHWANFSDVLICRWDNAGHWPHISTYPHHKHIDNQVIESTETSVADVLSLISQKM